MSDERHGVFGAYHRATAGRPPRATVVFALQAFAAEPPCPRQAVDLGCGIGRDTLALLSADFAVTAIDTDPDALATLRAAAPADARLRTVCARMQQSDLPAADLVVASFALPLMPCAEMLDTWGRIRACLLPGGRFAGQWFGDGDQWAGDPGVTCLSRAQVLECLAGLRIEWFDEEHSDAVTPRGRAKHWHLFHVVARQPNG